ncbi:pyroglutamyl-peptidase 1 isoform X1 [Hydra vulgaris]|uniref:pyroglutamyl-peptidase 1 isoform X1 n=1 Tax=Hydra vulgaris TaxID=6087 RepID=UPI001F5E5603|nr:pyroglutamyl-peptidase 1 isoform X1 [Hydra vulgaris]
MVVTLASDNAHFEKVTAEMSRRKLLLTGFGPFGQHAVNHSWLAVKEVADHEFAFWEIIAKEIAVDYNFVNNNVPQLWNEVNPDLVIHVGISSYEKGVVHLETCAHSSGYIREDINGCCPKIAGNIECSEDVCLETTIDVDCIVNNLSDSFPVVCKSNNAGRYLCEFIYYTSLNMHRAPTLFIHIPTLDEDVTLEKIVSTLINIVQLCMVQVPFAKCL